MATPRGVQGVGVYNFSEKLEDQVLFFSVLRLKQSFILWIGTEAVMQGLSVAMRVPCVSIMQLVSHVLIIIMYSCLLQDKEPACVPLLGSLTDIYSSSLAQRLGIANVIINKSKGGGV